MKDKCLTEKIKKCIFKNKEMTNPTVILWKKCYNTCFILFKFFLLKIKILESFDSLTNANSYLFWLITETESNRLFLVRFGFTFQASVRVRFGSSTFLKRSVRFYLNSDIDYLGQKKLLNGTAFVHHDCI